MHDDRDLVERRIRRELAERVLPLVHPERVPLDIEAGPDPDHLAPFEPGREWGPPWATTWFRFHGSIPDAWRGTRVEALIDLGFRQAPPGFQCEGLVVERAGDGQWIPIQGIHPNRIAYRLPDDAAGTVTIDVEAASNPSFPQFRPSRFGSPDTAGEAPLYRFRRAELVRVDPDAEALAHDLDVLAGFQRTLPPSDPRRERLLRMIERALDALPDAERARRAVADAFRSKPPDEPVHRVHAIGHAHIDTAWLWPIRETQRKCARTFASAVALMDDDPRYRFACSQAQQYAWIEQHHPELFDRIRERVARGQWVPVGGMWVEPDMNLPSGESLARQIVFGQRWFESRFGKRCTEVWIPDVFGYPAGLPQLFAAGGMKRFVTQKLSWNKQNRFPHHTFWWEGLDGTRVLTHFPPVDTYNAEVTPAEVAHSMERFREHGWSSASLLPYGYGDGGGGPTREMLERVDRLSRLDPHVTVEHASPAEFFSRVEREATYGAPVPVWRGELYFETHRGTLTSQLRTKAGNRRCEQLLVEAELWAAYLGRAADIDDHWRDVLTQQFHDILPGSSIEWVHDEAEAVHARVAGTLEERISELLGELCPTGAVVVNPADTAVDGVVVVADVFAADAPTQRLADGRVAVGVRAPALGVAPATPRRVDDRVIVTDTSMTNRHLAIRWDAAGNIRSVIDIDRRRELVPDDGVFGTLELAPDRPVEYDAWDLEAWTRRNAIALTAVHPSDGDVEVTVVEEGPLLGRVETTRRFGPSTATISYELRAADPLLRIEVALDWQHDEHLLSMAFPLDVRADTAACDVQFGVVHRPTHPSSPWDAAKFEVCAHRFVDLAEPDFGVAILNAGRYGHCLFDGAVRVSLARAARYPDPDADRGRHDVTLGVLAHGAGLADVHRAASLLAVPPRVVGTGDAAAGSMPAVPLVRLVDEAGADVTGVRVDTVKMADDGSGDLIVRLHEACGRRRHVTLHARRRIGAAWRCDLLEASRSGEEVGDGVVAVALRPFELVTLRLRLADDFDGRSR